MRKHFLLYINNSTTNKMSKSFLTVVHIVIHNGGNIHRSLKCCIQNLYATDVPTFNELVIKNTLVKR